MKAKILEIAIDQDGSRFYSSCSTFPGAVASGATRAELVAKLPVILEDAFKALGAAVKVYEAEGATASRITFVVVSPAALGRAA